MDGNWKPTQSETSMGSSMEAPPPGDWRNQLQPEARQRIVNKIMDTLKKHLPISVREGSSELRKIAIRYEEKIYIAAVSQSDYLRKISLTMLSMEHNNAPKAQINPSMPNAGAMNQSPADSGSLGMQSQVNNPGQTLDIPNRQTFFSQNLQNNTSAAVSGSLGLGPALPSIAGLGQSNISGVSHTSNLQTMSGMPQGSVNNSIGQGAQPDTYINSQRQIQGRQQQQQQQIISQQQLQQQKQQQPHQSQNTLVYQHQLQQQMLNRKIPLQQQQNKQQSVMPPNQLQSMHASLTQMPSGFPSNQSSIQQTQSVNMQSTQQSRLQQGQLNQSQQSVSSLIQQNQSGSRQQQSQPLHQQSSSLQQEGPPISQQTTLSQQQQMMGHQGNMSNIQQNQLLGQQTSIADIQQQQRLPMQQNNLSMQQQQQQHQMMNQQSLPLQQQQQQLGSQNNMSGLPQQQQQQVLGPLQRATITQKNAVQQQQQTQQSSLPLLQSQGQRSQHRSPQQQPMSQFQPQMQQQSNSLQREMQQRMQGSVPPLQAQNAMEQKPFVQAHRGLAEVSSSTSMESTAQIGVVDWQEECYQKVQSLTPKVLCSSVADIGSVVSMIDRIAGSAPGNGSRAAVGEDLVAMTKCRLQARNFISQDSGATAKKMKRHTSAMPLNYVSSPGSINDSFTHGFESPELESTATSQIKRLKPEVNHTLLEEIRAINRKLIDTVVDVSDEDVDSVATASDVGEGTVVKCSYAAVALSPDLKAQFASAQLSITPLRLLVPANYPKSSPVPLDHLPFEPSNEFEDLSTKAKSKFSISLRCLSQPTSLAEMAKTWDACTRKVILEYVQQSGGGSFSSTYGYWENCVSA